MVADAVVMLETIGRFTHHMWDEPHSEDRIARCRRDNINQQFESHQAQVSLLLHVMYARKVLGKPSISHLTNGGE
jgi:hypothetical protein